MKTLIFLFLILVNIESYQNSFNSSDACEEKFNLTVNNADGDPISNAVIGFKLCASSGCHNSVIGAYNTDSNGKTEIIWSYPYCLTVCTILVNGTEYSGSWSVNNTYVLSAI